MPNNVNNKLVDMSWIIDIVAAVSEPKTNHIVDIVVGTVTSIAPLIIETGKLVLEQQFLFLSPFCTDQFADVPIGTNLLHSHNIPQTSTQPGGEQVHSHSISAWQTSQALQGLKIPAVMIWRGLVVGDNVIMLKVAQGQKFIVLWRVGGGR